jgi:rubrerythrin
MAQGNEKELEHMIEVVIRAIPKEREARDLYRSTAAGATMEMTRLLFEKLASDEERHEVKLRAVLEILKQEVAKCGHG